MPSQHENSTSYTSGYYWRAFTGNWLSRMFTAASAHTVSSVKLRLTKQSGSPGTITVSIRATSGGFPTGSDLASGTTNGNTLATGDGEVREITFGTPYTLVNGTVYAIVIRAPSGDTNNAIAWLALSGGTGMNGYSTDSGSTWAERNDNFYYEVWGDAIVSGKVFRQSLLNGIGSGGPFFHNPLS